MSNIFSGRPNYIFFYHRLLFVNTLSLIFLTSEPFLWIHFHTFIRFYHEQPVCFNIFQTIYCQLIVHIYMCIGYSLISVFVCIFYFYLKFYYWWNSFTIVRLRSFKIVNNTFILFYASILSLERVLSFFHLNCRNKSFKWKRETAKQKMLLYKF